MDRAILLAIISMALFPGHRVDDQVQEIIEEKGGDRLRRMQV
jgi:hypothetical protein